MKKYLAIIVVLLFSLAAQAQTERPTMGWSSWNTYRVNISDSLIMRQADALVAKGLNKVGYRYVNIDDGYFGGRDKQTGRLLIHSTRFPRGLKPVVEHIHQLGLKAGIYSDAGRNTCGSIYDADTIGIGVGLYGHDRQDCDMFFRELCFDFIKVDYCGGKPHPKGDTLRLDEQTRYSEIAEAIRKTGRKDVRLNVCRWDYPGTWVSNVAISWRMSQDIRPKWASVKDIMMQNLYLSAYAGGGHYNDMDMLEVGRGMTAEEDHTHFAVWCMMSSPLLIGCDLTKIKPETLQLLTDKQLIDINQDPLGLQAYVAKRVGECYVLVKDLKRLNGKERAVAFVNLSDKEQTMTLDLQDIDLAGDALSVTLPVHATRVFVVKGKERLQRRLYEAETAFLSSYQEIRNNQAYLTAIYEEDSRCSGGVKASWLGGRENNDLRWRNVYVQKTGRYALHFKCMTTEMRTLHISVNGMKEGSLTYLENGEKIVYATLKKGRNEVRLWNAEERMPDVDYMIVDDAPVCFGKLTVEGRVQPLGLDDLQPRFGWQLVSGENDVRYLNERGMTVVTLKYRVPRPPKESGLAKYTTAWQDLQRTIRIVRSKADSLGLDPKQIGIMGSSAGGHLTMMGVTSSLHQSYLPIDDIDKQPCNVQWGIAIYPTYGLTDGVDKGNTSGGNDDSAVLVPEFIFDLKTAPMLFIHGDADGWAAMNSVKAWEKLRAMGIQSELHTLATRKHCFQRTASPGTGSYTWLDRIGDYLQYLFTPTTGSSTCAMHGR